MARILRNTLKMEFKKKEKKMEQKVILQVEI